MTLVRYEPWGMLSQLRRDMDRMFESQAEGEESTAVATSAWVPAVDIKEEKDRFLIKADIPGVDPKDIEVHMENGVLTIKGERENEKKQEREGYKRIERSRGSFYRRFSLPETADADKINAKSIVLIFDCAFRGTPQGRSLNSTIRKGDHAFLLPLTDDPKVRVLLSSSPGGNAYEFESLRQGLFTYLLCSGVLEGKADGNGDGQVYLSEAYQFAKAHRDWIVSARL